MALSFEHSEQTVLLVGMAWLFNIAANMAHLLVSQTASTACIRFVHIDGALDFISFVIFSQFAIQLVRFSTKIVIKN